MKDGITKEQSKMLQGLAILMMLYHHLFSTPDALGIPYVSLLNINGINIELHMAWFFKICVGIYAFVTGYGMYRSFGSIRKDSDTLLGRLGKEYLLVLKRLWTFYVQYLLVFILFMAIGFIFFHKEFVLSEFLLNLFGISSSYNGAWWYVLQYLKMMLTLPIIDCIVCPAINQRYIIESAVFYGVLLITAISLIIINKGMVISITEFFQPAFYLCFIMGYLISRTKIYELAYKMIPIKVLYCLGIIGFILVIVARVKMAKDASSAGFDFIFVPVFVYGFCVLMSLIKPLGRFFAFWGSYSTFIWLTHVFYYDHYAKNIVMVSHLSIGIYLTLLAMSLVGAVILNFVYERIPKGVRQVGRNKI